MIKLFLINIEILAPVTHTQSFRLISPLLLNRAEDARAPAMFSCNHWAEASSNV